MHSHSWIKLSVSPQCPLQEKLAQQHTSVQKHEGTNGDAVPHPRMMLWVLAACLHPSQTWIYTPRLLTALRTPSSLEGCTINKAGSDWFYRHHRFEDHPKFLQQLLFVPSMTSAPGLAMRADPESSSQLRKAWFSPH